MTILLGLLGLSLVVIVHELGHFLAARALGVEVEAFSIGWGPKLLGFMHKGTEWRLSAFPIGGFCRMKGEEGFKKALDEGLTTLPAEKGSFYGVSPWRRIVILFAGPIANVILAIVLFTVVSLAGISVHTAPNRIVLVSESGLSSTSGKNPADLAGLQSGDRILSVDGKQVRDYSDLQEFIGLNPGSKLALVVDRGGKNMGIQVTPRLDKESGQGFIGIYAWIDPFVASVEPGGAADLAGVKAGDIITSLAGQSITKNIDLLAALKSLPERTELGIRRNGDNLKLNLVLSYEKGGESNLGIAFAGITRVDRASSLPEALISGVNESWKTLAMTIKSVGLLFSGVDILKAVSGPARITYYVGNTANESLKSGGLSGLPTILSFLAFLSISLFFMNLLPIPALDGGQVVLSLAEAARRKPLKTKTIYRYQFAGMAMMAAIFIVVTLGDILFFVGK
ncbi:MAG: site-2 protease family protein [Spirochaetes bacterium]|nr:site-2 protease family protein [Spirochaetota bacterium]